ncbi:hypothetical protein SAMN05444416_107111 [Thermoactinomyces sp. DSM 45892]|nr:hypothetical protein SAMN05444416_107111 [Thermoactinomyces sp. DSM 45892]
MVLLLGLGFIGNGTVYAVDFDINVPQIQSDFPTDLAGTPTTEISWWDKTKQGVSDGWDWLTDKGEKAWDWTKEVASDAWDWTKGVAGDVWDYIMENKVLSVIVLTILGILAVIAGILIGIPLLVAGGVGSLAGMGIMGLVSWLSSDNGFMSDGMLKDMIIGGLGGILSAPLGEWIAGSKLATWIASKINISWLQSAFPRIFGGSVAGGADQGIMDFLSSGKFNWKNTLIAFMFGGGVVAGGSYVATHLDDVVKGINSIDISFATELFADGTASAPKTLGDTDLGQWLQKIEVGIKATQRRNSPGIATGQNLKEVDKMMRGTEGNVGIIGKDVGDQLIGKNYKNFDEFRQDFWKSVANSKHRDEFGASNVSRMEKGFAPIVTKSQVHGKIKSYVLHHRTPIHAGGEVYDLDNLLVVTPKMHQEILDKKYHFGN